MSILQGLRKWSKTLGKGSMYAAGGIALGYPVIVTLDKFMSGSTVKEAMAEGLYEATGYSTTQGRIVPEKMRNVVIRDAAGVVAVFVAKKL